LFTSVYIVQYNINWCKQVRPKLPWKNLGGLGKIWGPVPLWPQCRTATGHDNREYLFSQNLVK